MGTAASAAADALTAAAMLAIADAASTIAAAAGSSAVAAAAGAAGASTAAAAAAAGAAGAGASVGAGVRAGRVPVDACVACRLAWYGEMVVAVENRLLRSNGPMVGDPLELDMGALK